MKIHINETYQILEQIIIAGHDVLYQLFVRKAKIQETMDLRKEQIEQDNQ
jgi:hypothetical protein